MRVLLISTYDMGRQPFGLASPAAWLRERQIEVVTRDVSRSPLDWSNIRDADCVAWFLPMHTATRLAWPMIERVRREQPLARLAAYGLYAELNRAGLRAIGVDGVFGGEFEDALVRWVVGEPAADATPRSLPRLAFRVPDRSTLPALDTYARLQMGDVGRVAGYTEASRGCKHECRHCPVVPVYRGRFRVVPVEIVRADVAAQVAAGAEHVTFGDPDFFNGIGHALRIVALMRDEFPSTTFDVTIKVSHLVEHAAHLEALVRAGCLFVTSAVESVDDAVLERLAKGHDRAMFERAVEHCRAAGLAISPTFVPFTPWTTVDGYRALLDTIARLDLIDHVAPIQLGIRLLVPNGSTLLALDDLRACIAPFDPASLAYPWRHPDPRVDTLGEAVRQAVGARIGADRTAVFADVAALADRAAGHDAAARVSADLDRPRAVRTTIPYLTEPWYC